MEQNFQIDEINLACTIKYSQNKNTMTQINLLSQTFFLKYNNPDIIKIIKSNIKYLSKVSNFIPKFIKTDTTDELEFFLDFIPAGSLADIIYFKEKKINSPFINDFNNIKIKIIFLLINIAEIFIKNNLIHSSFTPEYILFTSSKKPIIGGIEFIQSLTNNANFFLNDDSIFSSYIAPEVKKGNPVPQSFVYSLSLLIYSIITSSFITKIPEKCPNNMNENLFSFLISCCNQQPNKRPNLSDIKREITKIYANVNDLNFDEYYSDTKFYGTKDNLIDLIEMKYPIAFYIVGSSFSNGNIFDMTSKEAISFLKISKENFSENKSENDTAITDYFKDQENIYISDIDEQINYIQKMSKEASNISFYNEDFSLVDDQINISVYNTNPGIYEYDKIPKYGFFGIQAINDCLEASKGIACPPDDIFTSQPSILSFENQSLDCYQSIPNAKLACREKCDVAIAHPQKRNVNLHSFTQIGALQVANRMFSELSHDINYDIVLNTGRGLHSEKSESSTSNENKNNSTTKNTNLDGNKSILFSTLSVAVNKFTGTQPTIGDNQGTLTAKITNIEKEENDGDIYF